MDRSQWPRPARELAARTESALAAASAADKTAFDEALALLGRLAPGAREQLATLLGGVTVALLERAEPDGLDAESAERLLAGALARARPWFTGVDDDLLLQAMTGALGIGGHEDAPRAEPAAALAHGLVLVAELLRATRVAPRAAVDAAMAELVREQTMEMP